MRRLVLNEGYYQKDSNRIKKLLCLNRKEKKKEGEWSVGVLSVAALHEYALGRQLCCREISCGACFADGVDRYALDGGDRMSSAYCVVERQEAVAAKEGIMALVPYGSDGCCSV